MKQKTGTPIRIMMHCKALLVLVFSILSIQSTAQITVTTGYTPTQMAAKLAGPGVLVFGATMTCPTNAFGEFVTISSILGLDSGIVLTSGRAKTVGTSYGVDGPASNFASTDNLAAGDASLTALAGDPTHDACILEFDFKPAGDTVNFKYVFGSEEYTSFACSNFNDVFGFFISGGAYGTPVNLAKVPGTSIPVCINSVNCGATGGYPLSTCTALGPGSPFCAYYVDNSAGTTVTYDGLTVPLFATALVSPCDTYHLKLGIADCFDGVYDSGVFIAAGSLTSHPPVTLSGVGLSGLPYCVRGCVGGTFVFSIPAPQSTPEVVHYNIIGTAVNGYDYTMIADSSIIAPFTTTTVLNINPTIVPPTGPKTVTLQILIEDPCHPGVFVVGAVSTLTILDSFVYDIITPDTLICRGDFVHAIAIGDTLFDSLLTYTWTPGATVSNDTSLTPNLTPTVTTTYTLTETTLAALGCPAQHQYLTITVYERPTLTMDSAYVKTCVGVPVQLHVGATPGAIPYSYSWSPPTYLNSTTIFNPVVNPSAAGDYTYSVTVNPTALASCSSTDTVHVHVISDFVLNNHDTSICNGNFVAVSITGANAGEISYAWTPVTGVATPTSQNPIITDNVPGTTTYVVTGSYAHCPNYVHSFNINVFNGPTLTTDSPYVKTCVGIPVQLHVTAAPGSVAYDYNWSPPTYLNNPAIYNPIVTPLAAGDYLYTITVNPSALPTCTSTDTVHVHVIGDFMINTPDAIICLGQSVTISVTGSNEISYLWSPVTGVVSSTSKNPIITPPAQGNYTYTATGSYAHCPDYVHSFHVHVDTPAHHSSVSDTLCAGMVHGYDFTVPGGGYYHYQWVSNPVAGIVFTNDTIPNPNISTLGVGSYVLTLTIQPLAASCAIIDTIFLEVLPDTIIISPIDTTICAGQVVQVIGTGNVNFTYQWLPTAGIAGPTVLNALITPDTSALYTVTAHFHSCPDIHATLNLDVQPNPSVYIGGNRLVCQFDTLHLTASVSPAWYSGYSYTWSPASDLDHTTTRTVVFSGSATTNLHVVVTTPAGCKSEDSALVTVFPGNFASVSGVAEFCPHDTAVLSVTPTSGVSYHWYPSIYLNDSLSGSPVISPVASQTYTVVATTANGCKDTVTYNEVVFPAAVLYLGDSVILYPGESYHITPMTNCVNFAWFPPVNLSGIYISDPVATPDVSTRYVLQASTEHGCKASDSISIYVSDESLLAMPNAFTPGTGLNNEFKIILRGIAKLNYFRIFNRWGNLLFESKDINKGWDGSWKGEPQPFGVYVYDIQAVTSTGRIFNKTGNITIIR